jgi:pseudouridine synthase
MNQSKLQKVIQATGFDCRRNIRKNITDGNFRVNNVVVKDPNFLIDITKDTIRFKEKKLKLKIANTVYFILNKPYGYISSLQDPQGRPTIKDLITKIKERVYPVGRLDYSSEGLILLTNDGQLTNFIISAKNKIPKIYKIKIKGILDSKEKHKLLLKGVVVDGVRVKPLSITFIRKTEKKNSWLFVTIIEGKKHIIRKIFQFSGHPVEKLIRIGIGTFRLKNLPTGHYRKVSAEELKIFKEKYKMKPS